MCLTLKGEVFVWGGHLNAKRGDDPEERPTRIGTKNSYVYHIPCQIQTLLPYKIVEISCGSMHSLAIDSNGTIFSWGDHKYG